MACCRPVNINRRLLPVKASSFFFMAALASLFPFLGIYMKQVGLTPVEAGIINGSVPFLGGAARLLMGALADRFRAHKILLLLCCVLTGLFFGGLLFVPHRSRETQNTDAGNLTVHCRETSAGSSSFYHCLEDYGKINCEAGPLNNDAVALKSEYFVWNATKTCRVSCVSNQPLPDTEARELTFLKTSWSMAHEVTGIHKMSNSSCFVYYVNWGVGEGNASNPLVQCQNLQCTTDCRLCGNETDTSNLNKAYDKTFWYVLLGFVGACLGFGPIPSLIDAIIYGYLGDERGKYGQQRVWGTVGYAVFAAVSGFSMDAFSDSKEEAKNYIPAFVLFSVLTLVTAILVWFYKLSEETPTTEDPLLNISKVLRQLRLISLLALLLVFGMLSGLIETFLYWHLMTMGGTTLLFGISVLVGVVPEIPVMSLSGKIIQKLGQVNMLYITAMAYAIRLTAYYFLKDPWLVLVIEPLHGIAFGLMYPAATSYASVITPAGMHGVMQGLISGVHFGLGRGCGILLSGLVYEQYEALTFLMYGIVAVISLLIYWLLQTFVIDRLEPLAKLRNSNMKLAVNLAEQQNMMNGSTDRQPDSSKKDVMDENTDSL